MRVTKRGAERFPKKNWSLPKDFGMGVKRGPSRRCNLRTNFDLDSSLERRDKERGSESPNSGTRSGSSYQRKVRKRG